MLLFLSSAVWAAGRPLHEEDAKRLEAFVLAENLLDFAARASSARAYLMAAELRLLYPVTSVEGQPAESVQTLLARGRALAPTDAGVQLWAGQLSKLASKSPRGEGEPLTRLDIHLEAGSPYVRDFPAQSGDERLVMVANPTPGLVMTLKRGGEVVETTTEGWLYLPREEALTLEIRLLAGGTYDLTLLMR